MADAYLGMVTVSRWRHARLMGLGDRKCPSAYAPCMVSLEGDPEVAMEIAPFSCSQDDAIPATMTFAAKLCLSPPFTEIAPKWESAIGHVLPPSLEEADVGEVGGDGALLPISWHTVLFLLPFL